MGGETLLHRYTWGNSELAVNEPGGWSRIPAYAGESFFGDTPPAASSSYPGTRRGEWGEERESLVPHSHPDTRREEGGAGPIPVRWRFRS